MGSITLDVGHGTATGIDPSLTKRLQESVGVVYKVGDPAAHKIGGRSVLTSSISGARVNDIQNVNSVSRLVSLSAGGAFHGISVVTGAATSLGSGAVNASSFDSTALSDIGYIVTGVQAQYTAPYGAFALQGNSLLRLGLYPFTQSFSETNVAGPGLTGTFYYWMTEYDSVNDIESAYGFHFGRPAVVASPSNQKVQLTFPATALNPSADKFRIYRTIDQGLAPIGWLVTEITLGTTTYTDDMTDATLVLNDPYRIVTINGIPESMDLDANEVAPSSIASFQGSLVGTINYGGSDLAFTPAGEPHAWPESYRLTFPTLLGGSSKCVRKCGDALYVAFSDELFRVNYLPDESDSVYDTNICIEHIANYGTASISGMCVFTGWGGMPVLFVASHVGGPILVAGNTVDRAVANIDWTGTITQSASVFTRFKAIDNPFKQRVELYYPDDSTLTTWSCLHFYYDNIRTGNESGPLPDMVWTGPHAVPGPGCYASDLFTATDVTPHSFTAGYATTGTIYKEDVGTTDAAQLVDSDGTVQFRLRTPKIYPGGIDSESRADRVFIHKRDGGDQDYTVTFTANRENGASTPYPNITISGEHDGVSSSSLNASLVSFDVRVVADGVDSMAPINNITVRIKDTRESLKTVNP